MLEPYGENVLLEIIERVDVFADDLKKRTGLLVPKDKIKQDEPNMGIVYAIGDDVKDPPFKVGDKVVFRTKEIFQGFKWDDKKLVSLKYDEVIASIIEGAV